MDDIGWECKCPWIIQIRWLRFLNFLLHCLFIFDHPYPCPPLLCFLMPGPSVLPLILSPTQNLLQLSREVQKANSFDIRLGQSQSLRCKTNTKCHRKTHPPMLLHIQCLNIIIGKEEWKKSADSFVFVLFLFLFFWQVNDQIHLAFFCIRRYRNQIYHRDTMPSCTGCVLFNSWGTFTYTTM